MLAFFASEHFTGSTSGGSSGNSTVAVGIPIIAGAKEVLKKYADRFDFHVVTSRQNLLEAETLRWLKHWYPGVFRGVEFGNHYAQEGIHRSKPDMCKEIGACLLIDDSMRYATQCASAGIPVVLFGDYAWNAGKAPAGVQRASDWAQVDRILSDLASSRSSSSGASASSCTMDLSRPGT
ncbi:hypothetical protein JKP88DRAFT_232053 [Tribonema minus]|uniref:Uncharacterized protein n=1 Tax=Tribonema minus TaxID=303371 RepID=A0A835ZHF5_9STRA|nr:hypothetical protein JKP88DRAFT_232053 [Tribonema minus]